MAEPILEWDAKDPDESDRFGVDWASRLVANDTVESSLWTLISGSVIITEQDFDDRYSFARISGGADGEVAEIQVSIVTAARYDLEVTRLLAIISSAGATVSGYTVPTPAAFVTQFPAFAAVDLAAIQAALTFAATKVDTTWTEGDYGRAIMLRAAHELTLDGHGSGTDATMSREGLSGFQKIKSASLEVTRFDHDNSGGLSSTGYGKRFADLQRMNFAGPRLVPGAQRRPGSPYATDF